MLRQLTIGPRLGAGFAVLVMLMALIAGAATLAINAMQAGAPQIVGRDLVKTELAHTVMETAAANAMKLVRLVAASDRDGRIPLYKDIDSNKALLDKSLAQLVALAILMPIVSSLGGNAGTQTLAVAVRALASKELTTANARRIVLRELLVGLVNGVCLALVMGAATYLFFGPQDHHGKLAIIVGSALIANIFTAALGGILMPLALEKMGRDPAVSSSIFVTFLTDFTGFFAVLLIAALLLH